MNTHFTDRYADNNGVNLHYMAGGDGPLVVFIHGFPDFWYTWRHQLGPIAETHSVAAMDTRGYNLSDQPAEEDRYDIGLLVDDVAAVIANEGRDSAIVIGHDWGALTAWNLAALRPDLVERLCIINMPHPSNVAAALTSTGSEQAIGLAYTDDFRKPGSETLFDPAGLADFMAHGDPETRARYLEAFERTSLRAAMDYYRQNSRDRGGSARLDPIVVPVLQFHGLDDPAFPASSLNDTWSHLANTWTLVTIPGAGHWPHHDRPDLVTSTIVNWLDLPIVHTSATSTTASEPGGCCAPVTKKPDGCSTLANELASTERPPPLHLAPPY